VTLRRTGVGPLRLEEAVAPDAVTPAVVRDPSVLVAHLPRREVDAAEREAVIHGRPIKAGNDRGMVAVFAEGTLLAVAEVEGELLKPRVVVTDA
jgi:tRNA U55 pseudouridine synthase TruB